MNTSRKLHHHSAEYWQEQMTNWKASGLKQTEFCQKNNLALSTFHKWQKKLRDETPQDNNLLTPFIELPSEPTPAHSVEPDKPWDVELSLGHGIILRLRQS